MTLSTRLDQSELERALNRARLGAEEFSRALTHVFEVQQHVAALAPFTADVTVADCDQRVTRGVQELDATLGRDHWLPRINVATLDVSSQLDCVVCQVTGYAYKTGIEILGGPGDDDPYSQFDWAVERGFALPVAHFTVVSYRQLTRAWCARVSELRAQASEPARERVGAGT